MRLTSSEYDCLSDIISKYQEVDSKLNKIQKELVCLEKQKDEVLNVLSLNKDYEQAFFKEIEEKYGKGNLDLTTLEYITTTT
jgi:uncharacterized protein YaaN involved in tellurite resistance